MSKGSWRRPYDEKKYGEGYDRIFRNKGEEAPAGTGAETPENDSPKEVKETPECQPKTQD